MYAYNGDIWMTGVGHQGRCFAEETSLLTTPVPLAYFPEEPPVLLVYW